MNNTFTIDTYEYNNNNKIKGECPICLQSYNVLIIIYRIQL